MLSLEKILQQARQNRLNTKIWVVLDGAAIPNLRSELERVLPVSNWCCLFQGEWASALADVAPYLVEITAATAEWLGWLERGWGQAWGIYMLTDGEEDLSSIKRCLRKWIYAYGPDAESLLFRWYDPRVFRTVLPCLTAPQQQFFFQEICAVVVDDENANGWEYEWHDAHLHIQCLFQSTV